MSWMSRLFSSFRQPELARSLEEEIESHIALRAEEYMREGMDAEEARRRARLRFGNRTLVQDACREADTFALLEDFRQDLRYGLRMLRKTPGFTLVALAVLALGIGANTAIFSVVRAVLLRPLPFAEPGRLAQILSHSTKTGSDFPWVDGRDVLDWRNESRSFAAIGAYHFALFNLADADLPESLYGLKVSANLFPLLGVQPTIGRNILAAEDQPGAGRVVLISDALWRRRFASDPAPVGRTIRLSGQDYQVIGIMPSGFNLSARADALPIFEWNEVSPQYFRTLGIRLQRGRYLQRQDETGQRLVTVIGESAARRLWPQYPRGEDPVGRRICLDTFKVCPEVVGIVGDTLMTGLDQPLIPQVYVALGAGPTSGQFLLVRTSVPPATFATPLRRTVAAVRPGQGVFLTAPLDEMLSDSVAERRFSMLLLSAFGALALVLAAVGIYGAISYAVAQRTHEIGIRMALGATAGDLRRLVLGEGLALAAVGVAMGLAGAFGLTRLMASLLFGVSERDAVVFAAVPAFLLAVALLACSVPAQRAVNVEPVVALRED